jgi:putative ATPase
MMNAVTAGIADIKRVIADSKNPLLTPSGRTVLFIDEIHRFQQGAEDALLPAVEDGTLILIGATTENPFFEVNKALISRSTVLALQPLTSQQIRSIVERALTDTERGLGQYSIVWQDQALDFCAILPTATRVLP